MEPGELVGVPKHGEKDELMQLGTERGRDERVQIFYLLALECLYASTGVLFLVASQNSGHRTIFFDRYLRIQVSSVERYCHAVLLQPWIIKNL